MYDIRNLNIWKKEEKETQGDKGMRDVDITELNLSVRSYNCLKRAWCDTVGDILDRMGEDGTGLRNIRNLGQRSEAEIKEVLERLRAEYARKPQSTAKPTHKLVRPAKRMMDRPISDFRLSSQTNKALKASGIYYVKDLYAQEMKKEPGWKAVRELFDQILIQL